MKVPIDSTIEKYIQDRSNAQHLTDLIIQSSNSEEAIQLVINGATIKLIPLSAVESKTEVSFLDFLKKMGRLISGLF